MTFVMSDIHGEYEKFLEMLKRINLSSDDTLYILGDVLDRGPHPIKTILKMMSMVNIEFIIGNHEIMAIECMDFLLKEINIQTINDLNEEKMEKLLNWSYNGSITTLDEFGELDKDTRQDVLEYLKDSYVYKQLNVNGRKFLLVHGGLENFSPERDINSYALEELVWSRTDYQKQYFDDIFLVTGHTPTFTIKNHDNPGHIYTKNNHIAIDCGASIGGTLGCICLDTFDEFYV